jgi:polar amino acid transport system substrate-binding protein
MKRRLATFTLAIAMTIFAFAHQAAFAQSLDSIRKAGVLNIGVKADSKPWGYLDPSGNPIGWEVDLAREVAKKIGVEPKIVIVTSANRIQFLEQGMIDLIIATLSDTPERRRVVHMIEPGYFADATNLLIRDDSPIKSWNDLKGRKLCGVQGAIYNRPAQQNQGAEVVAFAGLTEAFAAFKSGTCEGVIYADQILRETIEDKEKWKGYTLRLEPFDEIPWSFAIKKNEADSEFAKFLSDTMREWHKSGYLLESAKKWSLGANQFLTRMSKH